MNGNSFAEGYAIGRDGYNNNGNNGFFGNDGIWAILLLALLGFGNGYGGVGGARGGACATQADLSAGFANSEIMSDLNDILLSQSQGFSNLQQTLCQGFNGVNTSILQSANATERGFAQMGYNLANCCCEIKGAIADVKYANEKQTCDLITNQNANTQRILDYLTNEKICAITAENVALKGQISNYNQTNAIIGALKTPSPIPAYTVPNPYCCNTTTTTTPTTTA